MILAVDTETTGSDFWHGCKPFMIQACDGRHNYAWTGEVNPYNRREVTWNPNDLDEVQAALEAADKIVLHNAKFDMRAMETIGIDIDHLWDRVEDTIIASHAVCSGESHALKYLAFKYLGYYNRDERKLAQAVQQARIEHPDYDLAKEGHPCFPGVGSSKKVSWYKMDYWLCIEECLKYGMADVEMTHLLYHSFIEALHDDGLIEQYRTRLKLLPIAYQMERHGYNMYADDVRETIDNLVKEQEEIRSRIQKDCHIAHRFDPTKDSDIKFFLFHVLDLPVLERTEKTKQPSIAKDAIENYVNSFPNNKPLQDFQKYRKNTTQIGYLNSYLKWVCDDGKIRSNVWITGTRETRQSTDDPNIQNIAKPIRHVFGPQDGYVWLDFDLVNIELRIWTYEVGNKELLEIFESGGSVHLLIASVLRPKMLKELGPEAFKETEEYGWIKNGNFAYIYGASDRKANKTYKVENAIAKIGKRFPEIPAYSQKTIQEALDNREKYNYPFVTTLGGYRLDVPLDDIFKACNFKIQGSAGWIMMMAMINIVNNPLYQKYGCQMIQQVHDSAVIEVKEECLDDPNLIPSLQKSIEDAGRLYLPTCAASYKVIYPPAPF